MKILRIVDTREYEEAPSGKWVPIPGSGNQRECDRCGRLHEVHAYVETDDGRTMIVGTGCMGLGPEAGRKFASKAATVARLTTEREHIMSLIGAREAAEREVAMLTPPEPVDVSKPYGLGVEVGGFFAGYQWRTHARPRAEAVVDAERHWQEAIVDEMAGSRTPIYRLKDSLSYVEKRLQTAEKAIEEAVAVGEIG
jgi:hypothetical protein